MPKFRVVGAGMAGLLAAAVLRDDCEYVLEGQRELPNNHSALLRFKSPIVGDTLNVPFRNVDVMKAVVPHFGNPVGDALSYSLKTNGTVRLRSLITASGLVEQRWIAPENLISLMAAKVTAPIHLGHNFVPDRKGEDAPTISTAPMPVLMKLLDYPHQPEFKSVIGFNVNVLLDGVDVCASLYYPDPARSHYRASLTSDRLTIEYCFPGLDADAAAKKMSELSDYPKKLWDECYTVLLDFGVPTTLMRKAKPEVKLQRYGKIVPIDEDVRRRFMIFATDRHNIYSLGRFATWRSNLLLDDLVNDIRVIQRMANGGNYDYRK